jgi:hypothetical protein
MTLEDKFIQKESARKNTNGYQCVLIIFFLVNGDELVQYEKMVVQKNVEKRVKKELFFPQMNTLLHIITSCYFDRKLSIFYRLVFLPLSIYLILI